MIHDTADLVATQQRIDYFLQLLTRLRANSRPEEFPLVASGYRAEVERMQREVLDYLTRPAEELRPQAATL